VQLVDAAGVARLGVVIEVQLAPKCEKRRAWAIYEMTAGARFDAAACVLVVTHLESVARWARRPLAIGPSGSRFVPLVLGPTAVPLVSDEAQARALPELAVLSALAHGNEPSVGLGAVLHAFAASAELPEERAKIYFDLIVHTLGAAARRALEEAMDPSKYVYKSDFARKYIAQGRAEGKAEGRAEALLVLLDARRIEVRDVDRARILGCRDVETLDAWLARALDATTLSEILGD
jgi:hypothetical protein